MMRIWKAVVAVAVAGALITVQEAAGMAAAGPVVAIPLGRALGSPVPVALALGQPAILRIEGRAPTAVVTSPADVVDAIVHGGLVLLVPLREGQAMLGIGLGGRETAKLALSVGSGPGAREIALAAPAPTATSAPPHSAAPAAVVPAPPAPVAAAPRPLPAASRDGAVTALVAGLSEPQRAALVAYLQAPSLGSLSALVRLLSPAQRRLLVSALAAPDALSGSAASAPPPAPAASAQRRSPPMAATASPLPRAAAAAAPQPPPDPLDPRAAVSAPAGVAVHVIVTATRGVWYLSYVLQNETEGIVRADPRQVEIAGATGPVTVRQMDVSAPGEIAPRSMETGVIALSPAGATVRVTWRLHSDTGDAMPVGIVVEVK